MPGDDRTLRIAVLGVGAMGTAVACTMLKSEAFNNADAAAMLVTTRTSRLSWAADHPAVRVVREADNPAANREAAEDADVIVLGVRPEHLETVASDVAPVVRQGAVVVSLAAGTSLDALQRILPRGTGVVRAMVNLPIDIGEGVIGTVSSPETSRRQSDLVDRLLAPAGLVIPVGEEQFDIITAVPGAGPAYVSYFIEALTHATAAQGLPEQDSRRIVLAIVRGAIGRLDATGGDAEEVRHSMMHPGNVTETSMRKLDELGVFEAFGAAVDAGVARARKFSAGE